MALGDQTDPIPVKQGDTPTIRGTLWQGTASTPVPVTGATVVFNMRLSTAPNTLVVNRQAATLTDAANGIVDYTLTALQTATIGLYQAEFEATLSTGRIQTFPPGKQYIWIDIGDDIA